MTIARTIVASTHSPVHAEAVAAKARTSSSGLVSWSRSTRACVKRACSVTSFGPNSRRRRAPSSADNPVREDPTVWRIVSGDTVQYGVAAGGCGGCAIPRRLTVKAGNTNQLATGAALPTDTNVTWCGVLHECSPPVISGARSLPRHDDLWAAPQDSGGDGDGPLTRIRQLPDVRWADGVESCP